MTGQNKRANIQEELTEARRCRQAADVNARAGDHKTAVNRLYYACYHVARALLLTLGLEPKTHSGMRHLVALHFVKKGLLSSDIAKVLAHLEDERELADYHAGSTVTAQEYAEHEANADRIHDEIEAFLRAQGWI